MSRITDIAAHAQLLSNMAAAQSRIGKLNVQISSGKTAQRFQGLELQDTSRLIDLKTSHQRTAQFLRNIQAADQRLTFMENAASTTFDVAKQFRTQLINALNMDNASDLTLVSDARAFLETVAGQLNKTHEGRYLFSGTRTDTRPVDIDDPDFFSVFPAMPTSADTSYFQGDSQKLTVRADTDISITYGVTADQAGFEEIIRALKLVSIAGQPPSRDVLEEALGVTNQAIDDIPRIVSSIGAVRKQLQDVETIHTDLQLYLEQGISDIENVDVSKALTQLSQEQLTMEASFSTISVMRGLTLTNFL